MAKKIEVTFAATITLNEGKAGGWLAIVSVQKPAGTSINSIQPAEGISVYSAWKNASAAKRWVKEMVLLHTPRKSVKMIPSESLDAKGKPTSFSGTLVFKADSDHTFK
jgi:hypothetical protein